MWSLPILQESKTAAIRPIVDLLTTLKPEIDATMLRLAGEVTSRHPMAGIGLGYRDKPFTTADFGQGEFLHGNVDCVGATILLKNRLQDINRGPPARKLSDHSSGADTSKYENTSYATEEQKGKLDFISHVALTFLEFSCSFLNSGRLYFNCFVRLLEGRRLMIVVVNPS
jgi:hypothetical protein